MVTNAADRAVMTNAACVTAFWTSCYFQMVLKGNSIYRTHCSSLIVTRLGHEQPSEGFPIQGMVVAGTQDEPVQRPS